MLSEVGHIYSCISSLLVSRHFSSVSTRWAHLDLRVERVLTQATQRPAFFAVRMFLGVISVLTEARFYRTVSEKINDRVGRYLFFMLLFSAGMWNASTGESPSTPTLSAPDHLQHFSRLPSPCIRLRWPFRTLWSPPVLGMVAEH